MTGWGGGGGGGWLTITTGLFAPLLQQWEGAWMMAGATSGSSCVLEEVRTGS